MLPTVTSATMPDLNASWFLSAYAVAFALAIFVAVVLLLPQFIRTARGAQSGRELVESIGLFFPLFLVGAMFGPPFGVVLVNFFKSISDSIIRWGVTDSASTVTTKFQQMLTADDAGGIAGGAPVGVLLMLLMLTGLLLVVVMLIVQLVTLYFTGVLLPLGLVWIIDPTRRRFGTRIATIWVGILASHPLLFFLLAIAYLMVANSVDAFSTSGDLTTTVQLIVSVLALFLAGLSPFVLMKLAPILPTGGAATSGPAFTSSTIGPRNLTEADNRYGGPAAPAPTPSASQQDPAQPEPTPPIGASGPTAAKTGSDTTSTQPSGVGAQVNPSARDIAGPVDDEPATTSPKASSPAPTVSLPVPAGATSAPVMADGAAVAADSAVALGVGESATGVGAAIGVPTILAGVAMKGGEVLQDATSFVQDTTEAVGDHATAAVDGPSVNVRSRRG